MSETIRVRAVFDDYGLLENALRRLKESGAAAEYEAFGPVNLAEVEYLMPQRGSGVRVWATIGGILGLLLFFYMCVRSSMLFGLVVGGKPPVSRVPFVIIAYEGTILLGALGAFFAAIVLARLLFFAPPKYFDTRFTGDSFGIVVWPDADKRADTVLLLKESGATEIDESE